MAMTTVEPPVKRGRGRPRKPLNVMREHGTYAATMTRLEAALPEMIAVRGANVSFLAEKANVCQNTASNFLAKRARELRKRNDATLFQFSPEHAATLHEAADRQFRRLRALSLIPDHEWTEEHSRMERQALSCLKSVHPFLTLCALELPEKLAPLPDGASSDSPTENDQDAPATLADGL